MSPTDSMLLFADQMGPIQQLIIYAAYVIGFVMCGVGVYQLATGGGGRGQYSHGLGLGITLLCVGALVINLDHTVGSFVTTTYGDGASAMEALSSVPRHQNVMHSWVAALFNVLIVLGWIFALWGLMNLGLAGSRREKGSSAGFARLGASVFLTNPYLFAQMLGSTFGVQGVVSIIVPSP